MSTNTVDAAVSVFPDLFSSKMTGIKFWPKLLAIYFLLFGFYKLTAVSNHFEAMDRSLYADRISNGPLLSIHDNIELLFHAINRAIYLASHYLGFTPTGSEIGDNLGSVIGPAAVILMARLLSRAFRCTPFASWVGALCLGVSYGFWRYTVEVEVYIPSIFMVLATLNLIFDNYELSDREPMRMLVPGAVGGLSVLYYQPTAIPLFIAVSPLFLNRDFLVGGLYYGLAGLVVALSGYSMTLFFCQGFFPDPTSLWNFMFARMNEFWLYESRTGGQVALRAAYLVHYNIFAINWFYSFESMAGYYEFLARNRFWDVLEFTAREFRPVSQFAAVTYASIVVAIATILSLSLRGNGRKFGRIEAFAVFWTVTDLVIIAYLDSSNAEPYISIVPPIVICFSVFCLNKIAINQPSFPIFLFPVILCVHNYIGGLGMLYSDRGDYIKIRMAWLKSIVGPNDVVLSAPHNKLEIEAWYIKDELHTGSALVGSDGFVLYYTVNGMRVDAGDYTNSVYANGGRIFAFSDFFWPRERILRRGVDSIWISNEFKPRAKLLHNAPLGDVYEILPAAPFDRSKDGSKP